MNVQDIVIIEDEATPLSGVIANNMNEINNGSLFLITIIGMVVIALIVIVSIYLFHCSGLRKRYYALSKESLAANSDAKLTNPGWNLLKLRELVRRTESSCANYYTEAIARDH